MKNTTYNITDKKQAVINELKTQVLDAKYEVEQCQAIVNSLAEKANKFQIFLTSSEASKKQAQNNLSLIEEVLAAAKDVESKSNITLSEIKKAKDKMDTTASSMNSVLNKLIYSAEVINKLHTLLFRKKAINPLISVELIRAITTSATDANNAVALALVALKSSFTSQSSIIESDGIANLEYNESVRLVSCIKDVSNALEEETVTEYLIYNQLQEAYNNAKEKNEKALKASQITIKQLEEVESNLNKTEAKLSSLQAGLSAANAAALAS